MTYNRNQDSEQMSERERGPPQDEGVDQRRHKGQRQEIIREENDQTMAAMPGDEDTSGSVPTECPNMCLRGNVERQIYIEAKQLMLHIEDSFTTWQPIRVTNYQMIAKIINYTKQKGKIGQKEKESKEKKEKDTKEEHAADGNKQQNSGTTNENPVPERKPSKRKKSHTLWHGLGHSVSTACAIPLHESMDKNLQTMWNAIRKRKASNDEIKSLCEFWTHIMENDTSCLTNTREYLEEYRALLDRYSELGKEAIQNQVGGILESIQEYEALIVKGNVISEVILKHVPLPKPGRLIDIIGKSVDQDSDTDVDLGTIFVELDSFQKTLLVPSKEQMDDLLRDLRRILENLHINYMKLRNPGDSRQADSEELLINLEEEIIEWYVQRKRSVEEISNIIKQLNKHQAKTHKARTSGKVTQTVGFIFDILGGILIPVTLGASIGLTVAGLSLTIAGASTDSGALIVHKKMTKQLCETAVEILEADKKRVAHIIGLLEDYKACIQACDDSMLADVRESMKDYTEQDLTGLRIVPILKFMDRKNNTEAAITLINQMQSAIVSPKLERNLDELIEFVRTKGPSLLAQEFGLAEQKLYVPSSFEIGVLIHAIITSLQGITTSAASQNSVPLADSDLPEEIRNSNVSVDAMIVENNIATNVADADNIPQRPIPRPRKLRHVTSTASSDVDDTLPQQEVQHITDTLKQPPVPSERQRPVAKPRKSLSKNKDQEGGSDFKIGDGKTTPETGTGSKDDDQSKMSGSYKTRKGSLELENKIYTVKEGFPLEEGAFVFNKTGIETDEVSRENAQSNRDEETAVKQTLPQAVKHIPTLGLVGGGIDASQMHLAMRKNTGTSGIPSSIALGSVFIDDEDESANKPAQVLPKESKYQDIRARAAPTERLYRLKHLMRGLKSKLTNESESTEAEDIISENYMHNDKDRSLRRSLTDVNTIIDEEIRSSKRKNKFQVGSLMKNLTRKSSTDELGKKDIKTCSGSRDQFSEQNSTNEASDGLTSKFHKHEPHELAESTSLRSLDISDDGKASAVGNFFRGIASKFSKAHSMDDLDKPSDDDGLKSKVAETTGISMVRGISSESIEEGEGKSTLSLEGAKQEGSSNGNSEKILQEGKGRKAMHAIAKYIKKHSKDVKNGTNDSVMPLENESGLGETGKEKEGCDRENLQQTKQNLFSRLTTRYHHKQEKESAVAVENKSQGSESVDSTSLSDELTFYSQTSSEDNLSAKVDGKSADEEIIKKHGVKRMFSGLKHKIHKKIEPNISSNEITDENTVAKEPEDREIKEQRDENYEESRGDSQKIVSRQNILQGISSKLNKFRNKHSGHEGTKPTVYRVVKEYKEDETLEVNTSLQGTNAEKPENRDVKNLFSGIGTKLTHETEVHTEGSISTDTDSLSATNNQELHCQYSSKDEKNEENAEGLPFFAMKETNETVEKEGSDIESVPSSNAENHVVQPHGTNTSETKAGKFIKGISTKFRKKFSEVSSKDSNIENVNEKDKKSEDNFTHESMPAESSKGFFAKRIFKTLSAANKEKNCDNAKQLLHKEEGAGSANETGESNLERRDSGRHRRGSTASGSSISSLNHPISPAANEHGCVTYSPPDTTRKRSPAQFSAAALLGAPRVSNMFPAKPAKPDNNPALASYSTVHSSCSLSTTNEVSDTGDTGITHSDARTVDVKNTVLPDVTEPSGITLDPERPKSILISCQWPKDHIPDGASEIPVVEQSTGEDIKEPREHVEDKKEHSFGAKLARISLRKKKKSKKEKQKDAELLLAD